MAKPTALPEWDETEVNSVEPDATHKSEGWLAPGGVPEKPPFQTFNFWQNLVYKWFKYFDDNIVDTISNLILSNAADADHDITISTGVASDSTKAAFLKLLASLTKQIDAAWIAGDDVGGLFSGSVAVDTRYAVFIIEKDSDNSIDAGFDISPVAANIPAGYTKYRRIGWILTDGSANILGFTASEMAGGSVRIEWDQLILELNGVNYSSRTSFDVSAPIDSIVQVTCVLGHTTAAFAVFGSTFMNDIVPSATNYDMLTDVNAQSGTIKKNIIVDGSNQIAARNSAGSIILFTVGFIDRRVD